MRPRIFHVHLRIAPHTANVTTHVCDVFARIMYASTYATYTYARLCMCVTHCAAIEMRDFFKIFHRPKGF